MDSTPPIPSPPLLSDLSLLILSTSICLWIYIRYFAPPTPLVHPLLLGKQAEVSGTRDKGSSGIYRAWGTGHGSPLSLRPSNSFKTIADTSAIPCPARYIYGTQISNELLQLRAKNINKGLTSLYAASHGGRGVLNLLTDSFEAILLHLAIAQTSTFGPLHILQTPALLSHVLDLLHPPSIIVLPTSLLQPVLEQLIEHSSSEAKTKPVLVVVGDDEAIEGIKKLAVMAEENGLKVVGLRDLERVGDGVRAGDDEGEKTETEAVKEMDVECIIWSSRGKNEEATQTALPHRVLTAGISALLSMYPAHKRPSPASKDVFASCIPLSEPMGLALALAAVWSGAGFRTYGPDLISGLHADDIKPDLAAELHFLVSSPSLPAPTLLFLATPHLAALTQALEARSSSSPLYSIAKRQKLATLFEGHLAREGIWEKLLWRGVRGRKNVVGGLAEKLRWVGVVGDLPSQSLYLSSLVQLSIPITRITSSSVSTSPIFASHFYDFQQIPTSSTPFSPSSASSNPPVTEFSFTPTSSAHADPSNKPNTEMPSDYSPAYAAATAGEGADWKVHSGPPTSNVEVVLKGIDEEGVEERGEDAVGDVWVGGPGVVGGQAKAGLRARVLKNGVFLAL